ncbi:unnamed protein product [Vitrella brassicaformis CCMP3155]|uniref:asparagine--tRNA ligase n=1 Tax=Vitrella brassicaformis (strain CCMP3155) TaxID=1169540 RepID=A0A0G4ER15_VITBC|nr:unnamed protein product [Vitrella brassicaformis CCMP3155]|eukprot:CEM00011.1 unnamed protein product [Vitrella brassicaformis CCMP3155]
MKLRASAGSLAARKILSAARYVGLAVEVEPPAAPTASSLTQSTGGFEIPKLELPDGYELSYVNSILRYVAGVMPSKQLYGETFANTAEVDQWLDWTDKHVDYLLRTYHVEQAKKQPSQSDSARGQAVLRRLAASDEVKKLLEYLNEHMRPRTFLVGYTLTIADISLSFSAYELFKYLEAERRKDYPCVFRWFNTVLHWAPQFDDEPAPAAAASTAAAALAPTSQPSAKPSKPSAAAAAAAAPVPVAPAAAAAAGSGVGGIGMANGTLVTNGTGSTPFAADGPSAVAGLIQDTNHKVPQASFSFGGRVRVSVLVASEDMGASWVGKLITVCGWSRTIRKQGGGTFCFVELNDGSCLKSLQVVVDKAVAGFDKLLKCGAGCSFRFVGTIVESPAKGQAVELAVKDPNAHTMTILGEADAGAYPLSKKQHSREFLREIGHLRPRSNLIGAVARVRSALAMATHRFFQDRGFLYIHTPLITCCDCEGAGEMFQVTTVLPKVGEKGNAPVDKEQKIDYSKDFFGKPAFLTVSGQLAVENYACALSDVYTFGPTFRAENSNTSRHLAEFWMIEPEMAFADLQQDMDCAEAYVKYCVQWVLDNCMADLEFFDLRVEKGLVDRLRHIVNSPFVRITYTEAFEILQKHKSKFQEKPEQWGMDLGSEHERYLTEQVYKQPVTVYNYPKEIKAFYMRLNNDDRTVAAMDVLLPKIGEVIGGSQREERLDVLDRRIKDMGLPLESYWWYRDLRKYGSVPHAGFGLGFERLIMLVTGVDNIRDVIPFPRYPGHADF